MSAELSLDILDDWKGFGALKEEWNQLLRLSHADIVFLTWEWVEEWRAVNAASAHPFLITVRNGGGELVGLAPFYQAEYRFLQSVPYRIMRIMADYATGAECLDWIARRDMEAAVYRAIARKLKEASDRWDCIWMPYVPAWTGGADLISAACREQELYCRTRRVDFGFLNLPDDHEVFFKSLSRNRRSELRRHLKGVLGNGRAVVVSRCLDPEDIPRYLDALFDLHARRRNLLGDEGTFRRKPGEAVFYKKFFPVALEKGWLGLYGLAAADGFKAVQAGYIYNHVFYQLQEGFDPDFKEGAGNVLRLKVVEDCIRRGVRCYDFLGEMTEHKRRWLAQPRLGSDVFIGNRKFKNNLLFAAGMWPTGRYLRPTLLPSPAL